MVTAFRGGLMAMDGGHETQKEMRPIFIHLRSTASRALSYSNGRSPRLVPRSPNTSLVEASSRENRKPDLTPRTPRMNPMNPMNPIGAFPDTFYSLSKIIMPATAQAAPPTGPTKPSQNVSCVGN